MAEFAEEGKSDGHGRSMPWFTCFQDDWLEGTRDLTPDLRGIYFDCLCLMYKYGGPIDRSDEWMAHQLHISTRLWRSYRAKLVAAGKLAETGSGLANKRATDVIAERSSKANQRRTGGEPSLNQPRKIRENPKLSNEISKTGGQITEAIGEIEEEEKKDSQPPSLEDSPREEAAAGLADPISDLELITDLTDGDEVSAQRWLNEHRDLGSRAIRDAAKRVQADRRTGKRVVNPLRLAAAIAHRLHDEPYNRPPPTTVRKRTDLFAVLGEVYAEAAEADRAAGGVA